MTTRVTTKSTSKILINSAFQLILSAREQAVRQTNSLLLFTYFYLGKLIVEHEQSGNTKASYGKETLKELSNKLTIKFGQGFSVDNLENMRLFYIRYKHKFSTDTISETASRKYFTEIFPLSWSHYVALGRIKNEEERSFYEI